jgi:8-oxo-dGTP diphosphatase
VAHYCVNCGSVLVPRVIEGRELEACPHDDFVLWRDPKVATAVVVEAEGGVVFGRRAIEPGLGLWCLPGGFVNDDEAPADAAVRECFEEIGADVEVLELLGVYHIAKRSASSLVGIGYRARLLDGQAPRAGAEMLEVRVLAVDDAPQLAFPSHRQVLDEYVRSRGRAAAGAPAHAVAAAPRGTRPSPRRERRPPLRTR